MKLLLLAICVAMAVAEFSFDKETDDSIVIFQLRIDDTARPYNMICGGPIMHRRFILTDGRCLSLIKSDRSNVLGIKVVNRERLYNADVIIKVHVPSDLQRPGILQIKTLPNEEAGNTVIINTTPFADVKSNKLHTYYLNKPIGKTLSELQLNDLTLGKFELTSENLDATQDPTESGLIFVQKLGRDVRKDFAVLGFPVIMQREGVRAVVGVYNRVHKLMDAKFDGNKYGYAEVYPDRNFLIGIINKDAMIW